MAEASRRSGSALDSTDLSGLEGQETSQLVAFGAASGENPAIAVWLRGLRQRHGKRFTIFAFIGGLVFALGLGLQAALTGWLRVPADASYFAQAVVSVQTSFLLNWWFTWSDRTVPFRPALARFNVQRVVTIAINQALYALLVWRGVNYLVANVVLTAVFVIINYLAGDQLVFTARAQGLRAWLRVPLPQTHLAGAPEDLLVHTPSAPCPAPGVALEPRLSPLVADAPSVSVVIPCRASEKTIGAAVRSLLDQDYPNLAEVVLVGSPGDSSWVGLTGVDDRRLTIREVSAPPGIRDANFKRDTGIREANGDLVALVDSDVVLPRDWMTRAVGALREAGVTCVAGGMRSVHDSFWGRYTDTTLVGAKTPRIGDSYLVTRESFGARGRKPPITAATLFTPEVYRTVPIDQFWSHGSYEDYEWFWRLVSAGYSVLVCRDLCVWHHHRRGLRALVCEYLRSARGCAHFVRAHPECPFARRRLRQAVLIPLAAAAGIAAAATAAAGGYGTMEAAVLVGCVAVLAVQQLSRAPHIEAVAYPALGLGLCLVYTVGLVTHLVRPCTARAAAARPARAHAALAPSRHAVTTTKLTTTVATTLLRPARLTSPSDVTSRAVVPLWRRLSKRIYWPLAVVLAVQAALSLSVVWSNTAFTDESTRLYDGRLLWSHLLHGTPLPSPYTDAGALQIYPLIGAAANSIGGLAAARILSVCFMLVSSVVLYQIGTRLVGRTAATAGVTLWAVSEPVLRMAFADWDPLACLLVIAGLRLALQVGASRRKGEIVALTALVLALAGATALPFSIYIPVVIAVALTAWLEPLGVRLAISCASWLAAGSVVLLVALITLLHLWDGVLFNATYHPPIPAGVNGTSSFFKDAWLFGGPILVVGFAAVVTALLSERTRARGLLIAALYASVLPVPIYTWLRLGSPFSMDKQMSAGAGLAALAAGYLIAQLRPASWRPQVTWLAFGALMIYPAVSGLVDTREAFHSWVNTGRLIAALKPFAATRDPVLVGSLGDIPAYYLGGQYGHWQTYLSLAAVKHGTYSAVAIQLDLSAIPSPAMVLPAASSGEALGGEALRQMQVEPLAAVLQRDGDYKLIAVIPYVTALASNGVGAWAIWKRVR
jgi:putative flippase GtrA/GT2 family glycosyltransferase